MPTSTRRLTTTRIPKRNTRFCISSTAGEKTSRWYVQGHVDVIVDNLIAEKKARPMIIVMDNLNAVKPGRAQPVLRSGIATQAAGTPTTSWHCPGRTGGGPGRGGRGSLASSVFTEMLLTDPLPMVERTYRVAPGRENRAMAGLSMGGAQTFGTALANLDKFAYIGGFSGSSGGRGGFDPKTSSDGVFADAAAQQEGQGPLPRHRIGGRAGNEDVQRTTHASRHQEYLLRARHRARVADVAPLLQRVCSASVSLSSLILHPRCSNEPLPVRERTVWPPESNSRRAFCHRLDEGEPLFVDAHAKAGPIVGPHLPFLQLRNAHVYGTGRSP